MARTKRTVRITYSDDSSFYAPISEISDVPPSVPSTPSDSILAESGEEGFQKQFSFNICNFIVLLIAAHVIALCTGFSKLLLRSSNNFLEDPENTDFASFCIVCAGLSSRLQEYKSENAQLEELLTSERELSKSSESHIKQLQLELSAAKTEVNRVESNMAEAIAAKNAEIEALVSYLKKQAALSEENLASLQSIAGDSDWERADC
ncbi:uncharacterized protein LOC110707613 [Chenopodium quinoa]|uniref:uncharacterized protein LOC110707613 n=1 Tax=Chenopodium quinoa TaxID=63459 RepID=UPI000B790D58|nr:uncharacterized protein LOC110707613 [Chenopodium quinoa]